MRTISYPFIPTSFHGGSQSSVTRIVIHATVSPCKNGGARSIANYFATHRTGSAHYVVDPGEIVQCVREGTIAYHAPPNTGSIGIELCDPQSGSATRWADTNHTAMFQHAAPLVAAIAKRWNVPLVKIGSTELRAGKHGICGHIDVSYAWHMTDHGDPMEAGPFPWARFMEMVKGGSTPNWTEAMVNKLPTLKRGATGEHVETLQGLLAARSHPVKMDGTFGATTETAVKAVQSWGHLTADGVVGPKTWPVLLRVV
jgi:N-acetyl-anhydromuramyl-L-alanine amidase AmpD